MHAGEIEVGKKVWVIVSLGVEEATVRRDDGIDWWCSLHDSSGGIVGGGHYCAREMYANRDLAIMAAAENTRSQISRLSMEIAGLRGRLTAYEAELRANGDGPDET